MAGERILVIDPSQEDVRPLIEEVLYPEGYLVGHALTVEEGLHQVLDVNPDLLIADFAAPRRVALDVLIQIHEANREIPFILIGVSGPTEIFLKRVLRMGKVDYLLKPLDLDEARSAIARALAKRSPSLPPPPRETSLLAQGFEQINRQLEKRVRELSILHGIGKAVTSLRDLGKLLNRIVEAAVYLTGAEEGFLLLIDEETKELYMRAGQGLGQQFATSFRVKSEDSLSWQVVRIGKPIMISGVTDEERFKLKTGYLVKALLLVPLKLRGEAIGVLSVDNKIARRSFTDDDLHLLSVLADYAAIAIEGAKSYEELERFSAELHRVEQRTGELREALRIQSEFLSTVSHELRSPLASIKLCLEGTLSGLYGDITEKQRDRFELALAKASEEAYLIENLLDLVRIESGGVSLDLTGENLSKIIHDVIQEFKRDAKDKDIELKAMLPSEPLQVLLDRQKIKQVVANLVGNALKFTPGPGCVTVSVFRKDDQVVLKVVDTGIGIPKGEQDKIFDRFYQVDSSLTREVGGTGIGLSIVQNYVELHKGEVKVESKVNKGSTFTILIPANSDSILEEVEEGNAPTEDFDS